MRLPSDEFLQRIRKLLPRREYQRILLEMSEAPSDYVKVAISPLPKMGDAVAEGKVVGLTFVLDRPTSTYVPMVYAESGGKVRPVPWTVKK